MLPPWEIIWSRIVANYVTRCQRHNLGQITVHVETIIATLISVDYWVVSCHFYVVCMPCLNTVSRLTQ